MLFLYTTNLVSFVFASQINVLPVLFVSKPSIFRLMCTAEFRLIVIATWLVK